MNSLENGVCVDYIGEVKLLSSGQEGKARWSNDFEQ
jgi:hypothetical protein